MAINVDAVYKTVLLILNKEQRGYITPDEFNKTATQVQLDIFEQYFDDLNQQLRVPQADFDYSNRRVDLDDKISNFKCLGDCSLGAFQFFSTPGGGPDQQFGPPTSLSTNLIFGASNPTSPSYKLNNFKLYRQVSGVYVEYTDAYTVVEGVFTIAEDLDSADNWKVVANGIFNLPRVDILTNTDIIYNGNPSSIEFSFYRLGTVTFNNIEIQRLQRNEFYNIDKSDLTAPSENFPVYLYESGKLYMKPFTVNTNVQASFIRKPKDVKWAFTLGTVGQYQHSVGNSTNFELSSSEQVEVITRILFYSGVIIRDPQIIQVAAQEIQQNEINQKS